MSPSLSGSDSRPDTLGRQAGGSLRVSWFMNRAKEGLRSPEGCMLRHTVPSAGSLSLPAAPGGSPCPRLFLGVPRIMGVEFTSEFCVHQRPPGLGCSAQTEGSFKESRAQGCLGPSGQKPRQVWGGPPGPGSFLTSLCPQQSLFCLRTVNRASWSGAGRGSGFQGGLDTHKPLGGRETWFPSW